MISIPLADLSAIKPAIDFLRMGGAPVDRYLDAMNISSELVKRGKGKIAKRQMHGFLSAASRREGLTDFGYKFGDGYFLNGMGGLAQAVSQAITLKDAIHTFSSAMISWPVMKDDASFGLVLVKQNQDHFRQ
jgi:hypothetical protein